LDNYANNSYGYSIYWKNLVFQWPSAADGQQFQNQIYGGQFDNVDLLNGLMNLGATKEIVYGSHVTGAYRTGVAVNGGDWKMLVGSSISACGHDWVLDHQAYFSEGTYYGIQSCDLDGTNAAACYSGLKVSGGQKFYVADNYVTGTLVGFDAGSNTDDRIGQDAVWERNHIKNVGNGAQGVSAGFWMTWVSRYRIYNNIIEGVGGYPEHDVFHIAPDGMNYPISDVKIRHNTVYDCDVSALGMDSTSYWSSVVFENNIVHEASTSNYFVKIGSGGSPAQLTCDGNCYFRSGAQPTTAGMFHDGTSSLSFNQWKNSAGFDIHGRFADPQFTNVSTSNFRLKTTSPCINGGISMPGVYLDCVKTVRPLGAGYDEGAYEMQ
jgi:hypothetical protein